METVAIFTIFVIHYDHEVFKATLLSPLAVKVICDHMSGKSKGYGFVQFTSEDEARVALKEMDGQVNLEYLGFSFLALAKKMCSSL